MTASASMALPAAAQEADHAGSWRRPGERPPESAQNFALELRFGPYQPNIDKQFPAAQPYAHAFGPDNHTLLVGFEFDWQLFRIPYLGTLAPALGWGYTRASGTATYKSNGQPSAETTYLSVMPMYAVGVFRFDTLARETVIPLVGYAKAGLGYGLWWTGNNVGTQGKGHTWGTQFALGGMFLLDSIDPHSAAEMDNEWGINGTYFFVEWMKANLDGFGSSDPSVLNIGTSTWVLGLAVEM